MKEKGGESRCLNVADKGKRRMMMMIRGQVGQSHSGLNVEGGGVLRERREHVGSVHVIWGGKSGRCATLAAGVREMEG